MSKTIGVLGASGALGKEIVAALEQAPYKPETLVPLARANTKVPFVRYDDRDIPIDAIEDEDLERLDLLFLATPSDVALEWGTKAIKAGVPVVDCSGSLRAGSVPVGIPWVNPEVLKQPQVAAMCVPSAEAILAATVLGPLIRAGLGGDAEATFLVPASRFGQAAVEELSGQVIALFNSGTPPRKVFPDGLAFDLLPSAGEVPTGWTPTETRIAEEIQSITGTSITVTRLAVPLFSGMGMELRLEPNKRPVVELVQQILADGGVSVEDDRVRSLPRPRRVEGKPFPQAGRIRVDERGEVLRIWAAMDNLRGTAVVAVGLGGLLLGDESDADAE